MAITRGTLQLARRLRRDIGTEVDQVVRDLTSAWIKAWDELATPWQLAAADLVAEAVRLEHWPRPTDIARLPRVIAALDASEQSLQALAQQTADAAIAGAKRVIDVDVEFEARIIASQAPTVEQEGLLRHLIGRLPVAEQDQDTVRLQVNSRIRTDAVDVMRRRTAGQITADTFPLAPDAAEAMRRELIRGVDVGANPREAGARMVATTEGAFNGGLTRAMVISRTEMLDAYRATSQQIHASNSDIVPAWSWLSALDARCCPSCLAMHGTVHPVTEPGPDDHPQGRCGRLPELAPWAQLGINAPEPPSVLPDAEEWFAKLPRATQLRIMGPGRLQLLENGSIGWDDLSKIRRNPGWRQSRIPTPLRELRQRTERLPPTPRAVPPARLANPTLPIPRPRTPALVDQAREHAETIVPASLKAQVGDEMQRQAALTPGPMLQLRRVNDGGPDFSTHFRTANAYYTFAEREIYMHPQWGNPVEQGYRSSLKHRAIESGFSSPTGASTAAGSTAAHEFGHHLHGLMRGMPAEELRDFAEQLGTALKIQIETRFIHDWTFLNDQLDIAIRRNKGQIEAMVSTYGATNAMELLAEIWQEYSTLGDKARPHIREAGRLIQSVVTR